MGRRMGKKGKTILLLGPPGAGKSTLSFRMRKEWENMKQFSVRVYGKKILEMNNSLSKLLKEDAKNNKNMYMPDWLVLEIFANFLLSINPDDFLVIEGFPINREQNQGMLAKLNKISRKIDGIIILDEAEEVLFKRVGARRICAKCEMLHGAGIPLNDTYVRCPYCGGKLEIRREDSYDRFKIRVDKFKKEVSIILDMYKDETIKYIRSVNKEDVWKEARLYIEEYLDDEFD